MVRNVFHQYAAQRAAAGLALFAILLILVAPLISVSLQQDPMSAMPGMHHEMSMPMHAHHDVASPPNEMSMPMRAHHDAASPPNEMSMPLHAHHDAASPPNEMSMPLHAHHDVASPPNEMSMPMRVHHDVASPSMSRHQPSPQSMPLDHAEACGYCVLLAHVPGLLFLVILLLLGRVLRICLVVARQPVQHWHFFPWLCPDTRAPPRVCFS
ncbi:MULTISPECIES: hypothetical protein [Kosakonia]|uniref:hypothetical protein n=1 Tax=Kosakonia TaxID=1330547 RepID=UPI0005EF6439|nr:hypothetical protein DFO56_10912 [Kosakonia sp. AG348]